MSDYSGTVATGNSPAVRTVIALAVSVVVTFILFAVMQSLVAFDDNIRINEEEQFRFVDVVQDIKETEVREESPEIEKPVEVEVPEQVQQVELDTSAPSDLNIGIGPAAIDTGVDLGGLNLGPSQDGDYLPLVRVQPTYPRRAAERGVEGYVIVELTVAPDGTVPPESIVILEADPKGYFEREAQKAAAKFKYKPKVVNGEPQEVTGVTYKFTFNLAQ